MPTPSRVATQLVLMVEDNADHVLLVQIAAGRVDPDVVVRTVATGEEAVAYLSGTAPFEDRQAHPRPALVILDLLLPGLGGMAILKWAAEDDEVRDIPRVVLSSSVNPGDRERALELGAVEFHSKPSDVFELGDIVGAILRRWLD